MHGVSVRTLRRSVGGARVLLTGVLLGSAFSAPLDAQKAPTSAAITAADLRQRLFQFADDSMGGRAAGTDGQVKATAWLAAEAERLGLVPAGDRGTYFQDLPLVSRGFLEGGRVSVGGRDFLLGPDFGATISREGVPSVPLTAPVILGGELGDTASYPSAAAIEGRIVLLRPSSRTLSFGARALQLPPSSHFVGAAAIIVPLWEQLGSGARRPYLQRSLSLRANTTQLPPTLVVSDAMRDALLKQVGQLVQLDLRFAEVTAPARNVVAVLPGGDSALRGQYVALGAHNDHDPPVSRVVDHDSARAMSQLRRDLAGSMPRGRRPSPEQYAALRVNVDSLRALRPPRADSIRNGADDDGSGAVALLEVAEALALGPQRPRRSVLFVWHSAEELGLLGADWFTDHATVPLDSIIAQVNLDMVGRGGAEDIDGGGPRYLQMIGARRLSSQLGDLVERVNLKRDVPFLFDLSYDAKGHRENIYCRSDHAKYARYGIPVVFLTTGMHADYHQVTDEPQYIDYDKLEQVSGLVKDITLAIGDRTERFKMSRPRPAPGERCRQ